MKRWMPFSQEEVKKLCSKPTTLLENSEIECPCCRRQIVRNYYHEMHTKLRSIGSSWFWCYECKKYTHFTGPHCSDRYEFNDPIKNEKQSQYEGGKWYEYLNSLWESGVLPQKFKLKDNKKSIKKKNKSYKKKR